MKGAAMGGALGLGVGVFQAIEGVKAANKMKEQARRNRDLAFKQADWMEQNWNELAKPAMLRQQTLEKDAQEGQFADSGVLTNMGSAMVARYYTMRNQNLELLTKDREISQQAYITREQGDIAYKEGMIQARIQKMNAILGAVSSAASGASIGNSFSSGAVK